MFVKYVHLFIRELINYVKIFVHVNFYLNHFHFFLKKKSLSVAYQNLILLFDCLTIGKRLLFSVNISDAEAIAFMI